ncbi:hypothetical protein CONLIGDRAFT_631115 [Coniochaeta ligniaria NRRL 30616]|uniref:Secreted protein n=1 Tax=Coniochaeta ligniaria NRRL 30616 TaxID=1408157 RepID=A0A1J7JMU8_9PEZI|nr:hypothetical protein CONLIGDRAFT_631115 [Coniochaeta ligniaria NRRL 30616]
MALIASTLLAGIQTTVPSPVGRQERQQRRYTQSYRTDMPSSIASLTKRRSIASEMMFWIQAVSEGDSGHTA